MRDEVRDWALRGMEVAIPRTEIERNAWRGSVFRVEDPETGAAGYFLAGGLAGGATTEAPENWVLQFLAAALAAPYTEPNPDALAGASIRKLESTDEQSGEVGELTDQPLAVEVRDIFGAPVFGAAVTFGAFAGGGSFVDDVGHESSSLVALTNAQGVASVRFRFGTSTAIEPVFRLRNPDDSYSTRFGAQIVEAAVATHEGDLPLATPFALFAAPGPATHLVRTNGSFDQPVDLSELAVWADSIFVEARDRFENPVSNVTIDAGVEMVGSTPAECLHPVLDPRTAAVFARDQCVVPVPLLGECGGETASRMTSASGAQFGVISPNEIRPFHVVLDAPGLPAATQIYGILYDHVSGSEICTPYRSGVRIRTSILSDEKGNNIQAARPGATYGPVRFEVLLWDAFEGALCTNCGPCGSPTAGCHPGPPPAGGVWRRGVDGTLQEAEIVPILSVSNGGLAAEPLRLDPGVFETSTTVGNTPGKNVVEADLRIAYNLCPQAICAGSPTMTDVVENRLVIEIWSVLPTIDALAPDPIPLDDADRVEAPIEVAYSIDPGAYQARTAEVALLADGEEVLAGHGTARQGSGQLDIQRGIEIDTDLDYAAQLVLNRGSAAEVRSDPFPLPLAQRLFAEVSESVVLSQDVDVVNQRVCAQPDQFHFFLTREAAVTLEFFGVKALAGGAYEDDGSHVTLIAEEVRAEGAHDIDVSPADLPPGRYRYVLHGVATGDGIAETREGFALSEYQSRDTLPVGHELVKGIDLFDGHLTLSREDFSIPGRGGAALALSFARTYSSSAGGEGGALGLGWSMNWGSKVLVTPCGEAIVVGGEGSGMRFVDDGAGGLRPLKGYHGSLVANADYSFDFFTKSGNRYHYLRTLGSEWELDTITDPNGNATRLLYEASVEAGERRVSAVVDASGRTLRLHWEVRQFVFWRGEVIVGVEGPLGIALTFSYDGFGNLTRATREPHGGAGGSPSYAETYHYEIRPEQAFDDHHVLIEVEDEVRGASTHYDYEQGTIGIQGTVSVPRAFVTAVREPEGGTTGFAYPLAILGSPGDLDLDVEVTDRRGKLWRHRLNRYGAPIRREDPLGHVTLTTWTPDDVLVESRTDANGNATSFTYDSHGNELTESVTVTDVDNVAHTYTTTTTYEAPASFDPPYIKDRPATRTDRTGHVTELDYDAHGNLLEQAITVHDVGGGSRRLATGQTFFPNGDLKTRTDPRGHLQSYGYDSYGNRTQRTDALGHPTTWDYDLRGRLTSETDARAHTTTYAYDTLDRRIGVTYPAVDGDTATASVLYDDANRRRTEIDERNRETTTGLDREGRVLSVDNAADGHKAFEYDDDGNKRLESTWFDGTTARQDTTFVYDDAGRLVERHEPLGRTTVYAYDDAGNVVRETLSDALDLEFVPRVTESRYDALNRRIELSRHLGSERAVSKLLLDGEGNVLAEEDPLQRRTTHRYDELQRRIETTAPEWRPGSAKVTQFLYDGNGNRTEERRKNERRAPGGAAGTWEAADQIRTWVFDDLDRVHQVVDAEGKVTTLDYDDVGNLTREINPRLAVTEHEYDARNRRRLTRQKLDWFTAPARNVVTEFDYDAVGNLAETRLPNGNVVTRQVDALNRLLSESDSLGPVAGATYDARGNPKTTTDANGNVTTNHYDALDRLIAQDLPEDRHVASTYDAAGNKLTATDARDNTTRFQYDALNRLTQTTAAEPFSFTELFSYDLAGNRLTTTNRRGKTTTYEYDALNRVTKITDPAPLSFERTFVYDAIGNLLSETDRREIETQSTYDRESRRTSTRRAGLEIERVEYDAAGNRAFVTDANLNITGYQWDERNLLLQENRPLAAITKYRLDDMGDRVEAIDPENKRSLFGYDLRRRLTTSTNGAGETTAYCYDDNGNRTGMRHPKFAVATEPCAAATGRWGYEYDDANRLVAVVDPLLHRTEYEYDANGNRTVQRDANLHATGFAFDELNRLTTKTYPGGAGESETYGYDENSNRTSLTDPKGQSFTYGYDALDRLTAETLPNPAPPTGDELETRTTVYDPNGNVTRQEETYSTSGLAVETQTWDDFDRLLLKTDRHGETVSTTYDANGNRKSVRDSDGVVTTYTYDALNRLASQTGAGGVTSYDYFKNSLPKKTTYPNGASATQTYDLANRTLSITNRQNAALIASYVYAYDDNGNRSEQLETNGGAPETTTYGYDDADRLTEVHYPDQTVTYTLDPVGNRETETIVAAGGTTTSAKTLAYDVRDRLLSVTDSVDPANDATLAWDENGNQISKTQGSLIRGQIYDALDRLVEVQDNGLLLERYSYDPAGFRIRKADPGGIFRYVRDDSAVLQQTDDAGATIARYEWGGDRLVSMSHTAEGRSFSLFDGLGSVVALSRPDGGIQTRYLWDAWGNLRNQIGDSENLFGYTGYEKDDATGLYYAKARYLDPELGRFLSEDSFGGLAETPPSLHRFLYAYANPAVYWDPDGRESLKQTVQDYATEAYGEGNWFEKGIAFLSQAAYAVAEAASVGAVGRIGNAQEQLDRGEITKDQYWQQTGKAVVKSGAILAVGAATGGAGALVARGAGAGATASAVISGTAAGLGAQAGGDLVEGELSSAQDYAIAGGLGAAGGLAARGILALKASGIGDMTVGQATRSVVSKVKGVVLGESASTGSAAVAEVSVTQSVPATTSSPRAVASELSSDSGAATGEARFQRWRRSEAIDKPLPDGRNPSWDVVRSRYWKNRYEASRSTGEFSAANLERMRRGTAPVDYNPRTGVFESRELHHVVAQQHGGANAPLNLRELTPDWHAEVDPLRIREGVATTRGIQ
ncbi:MAG: RHS repeat protein [Thermoanaerobaculia bacterium]|nr:RHS repeat protein [Thermoanaerobaculia bacterium]